MNFLLNITYKDSFYALPVEKRTEIVGKTVAFHDKYLKAGKLKDTYTCGNAKLILVWNVASLAELMVIFMEHPYYGLVDFEAVPFLDHKEIVELRNARATAIKTK